MTYKDLKMKANMTFQKNAASEENLTYQYMVGNVFLLQLKYLYMLCVVCSSYSTVDV